jgi:hypothetical protein
MLTVPFKRYSSSRPLARSRRLSTAAKRPGLSAEAQAHLQDSADTLQQALTAKLTRTGA